MSVMRLVALFRDLAVRETRGVLVSAREDGQPGVIAPDDYVFDEAYCVDPNCDCRRVIVTVIGTEAQRVLATISHSFEPPRPDAFVKEQTFLDPLRRQSERAAALLDLFLWLLKTDEDYRLGLVRHYEQVKAAVNDPENAIHERIPEGLRPSLLASAKRRSSIPPPPPRRGKRKWR